MRPYGERPKVRQTVRGHQRCGTCHPKDVVKKRARQTYECFPGVTPFLGYPGYEQVSAFSFKKKGSK